MRSRLLFCFGIFGPVLVLGLGCPTPPEPSSSAGGATQPGPGGQPGPRGATPGPGPASPSSDPGGEAPITPPPDPGVGFSKLIESDAQTVSITGTLVDQTSAIVDFVVAGEDSGAGPQVIHTELVTDGSFTVVAPDKFDHPIYVAALIDEEGDGPSPDDQEGFAAEPFELSGADVVIEVRFDSRPDWADEVFQAPEGGAPPVLMPPSGEGEAPPPPPPPENEGG